MKTKQRDLRGRSCIRRRSLCADCVTGSRKGESVKSDNKMAKNNADASGQHLCTFCMIARGQDREAQVLKKDRQLACFRDVSPAAPHHYLVVPKQHIKDCLSLHSGHAPLVEKMADVGRAALRDQGVADMTDVRIGFHQPPYTSVDHLHLHVLAPASQIAGSALVKFLPGTASFVDVRAAVSRPGKKTEGAPAKCSRPRCRAADQ
ncbi:adenosine 5'-monophosphoramidase HINT3-like [Syngnathoides biaculeatus]|uniref:adenosine 5'-monophosphoramidase HINT3-like n=1 Tax=Syngnathoides biaculeatus TaxID=300417 RepID=UPI002ADE875A|nr:adenosine 5'-monophosphoramidase HINT3-like [Syngnathoides biaculeatus]